MKNITVLALVASLGLAAPALAQTPADIKNFRSATTAAAVTETQTAAPVVVNEDAAKKTTKKAAKKAKKAKKATTEIKNDVKEEMKEGK